MQDLKILVLMVALNPLYGFCRPLSYQKFVPRIVFTFLFEKGYKPSFLESQDHARMEDLRIPLLMVVLKPLHDFTRPISYQKFVFIPR